MSTKIKRTEELKAAIFQAARRACYTRKEIGALIRKQFSEYTASTISTYISDSFNIKYAKKTGCGLHRMIAYQQVGNKKIIVVR